MTTKDIQGRASVSPVVMEMHRQQCAILGLRRDHFQTVASQEVEHANLSIGAAGQHAKEGEAQRFDLPAGKVGGSFREDISTFKNGLAYFGCLKVTRQRSTSLPTLQAMTWPSTSADKKCRSSRNRRFTQALCASITSEKERDDG